MKRLDDLDLKKKADAEFTGEKYTSKFSGKFTIPGTEQKVDRETLRWSDFKRMSAGEMLTHVQTKVFPFLKQLNGEESPFTRYMKDAAFIIPKPSLLVEAMSTIEEIFEEIEKDAQNGGQAFQDIQGDVYEMLLSEIASAGKNGQFRTPRHIIKLITELVAPQLGNRIADPAREISIGEYIVQYIKNKAFQKQKDKFCTGAIQPAITNKGLKNIKLPLPPLDDQIRIAAVLTRAEKLIAKRKESIEALDELVKSTFLEMFGDPVRNEKGWERKVLGNFGQIITGNTPPRNDESNYSVRYIEWIKTDNIVADKIYLTIAFEYLSEEGLKKSRFVNPGALLVACIAGSVESIGRAAIADRKVAFNQQINAIQPNGQFNSLFLYRLFKLSKKYIQSHAAKGMKKILTKGDFEKIIMVIPPLPLQNQFAAIVEKVESIKSKYAQSLAELENLYGSLSQRAFAGELDLSRVPVEEENATAD